jgi:serine/threonine protein kinase
MAVMSPFYPITMQHVQSNVLLNRNTFYANVTLCGIASIKAFAAAGISHGDIKPSNIMLDAASQITVLIDFGTAEVLGGYHTESTPYYSLDYGNLASVERDLICLATSVLQLGGADLGALRNVSNTCEICRKSDHISHKLALIILENRERTLDELMQEVYQYIQREVENTNDLLTPADVNPILL